MKNETKLEKVKKFLDENNIESFVPKRSGKRGHSNLVLPKFKIYIKIQGDDDQLFYERHFMGKHPIFVRDEDKPKFVLEKVQNTIIRIMRLQQKKFEKSKRESL